MRHAAAALLLLFSVSCRGDEAAMKIDAPLSKQLEITREEQGIPVIITLERAEDLQTLTLKGIKPHIVYQNISAVAATLTPSQIKDIAKMPQVKAIELDSEASALGKP
jgi:hypothetical protein